MIIKRTFIVHENEQGLLFKNGRLDAVLMPGKTVRWGLGYSLLKFDTRTQYTILQSHEIACSDGIAVRAGARAMWRVSDVAQHFRMLQYPDSAVYYLLHEELREAIGGRTHAEAMESRLAISSELEDAIKPKLVEMGIELVSVAALDFGLTGEVRKAYAQSVIAQKTAFANLERARGEIAALRSLANAAKMLESNPNLAKLRWIQALEKSSNLELTVPLSAD